jgi:hypothetical protein
LKFVLKYQVFISSKKASEHAFPVPSLLSPETWAFGEGENNFHEAGPAVPFGACNDTEIKERN